MLSKRALIILFYPAIIFLSLFSPAQSLAQEETNEQKIQRLSVQLNSNNEKEQIKAASELGALGKSAIPALVDGLKTNKNSEVLHAIAGAFGTVGKDAVPVLVSILQQEVAGNKDIKILRYTANALKNVARISKKSPSDLKSDFKSAVPILMQILDDKKNLEIAGASNYELLDFDAAADCLGYIGRDAKAAVPLLIELTKNEKNRKEEEHYKKKDAIVEIIKDLKSYRDFSANDDIRRSFDIYKDEIEENDSREIGGEINELETAAMLQYYERLFSLQNIFNEYPTLVWFAIFISLVIFAWLFIFIFKPLWLLKIYEVFPIGETRFSGFLGMVSIPIQYLLASIVLRPRVLDAWVNRHLPKARSNFLDETTVKDRQVYVPVGLFINHKLVPEFTPQDLKETFDRNQSRILISGMGGVGKTSLACQIADWAMKEKENERLYPRHLMIPVLLEHDFTEHGDDALKKAIFAQLFVLIDADKPISNGLLQALLEKKRVLVLIDGMSEMSELTQTEIISGVTKIPVNAVVFTSRSDEAISGLNKTVIQPTTIKGNQLSSFVEAYLISLRKKELFEDEEFFEGCRILSTIVNDRSITALLAKLFVDLMVAKQEKDIEGDLPDNIPKLMKQSIEWLYSKPGLGKIPPDAPPLRDVIKAAKAIAWECLKKDYRPLPADYEKVKKALINVPNGQDSLNYLRDKLKLIETTFADEKIRFKIDPLAEYLAGMYLVEENKYNADKWRAFFDSAESKPGFPESIKGFLLAVRDCCRAEEAKDEVPGFAVMKLTAITDTDLRAEPVASP